MNLEQIQEMWEKDSKIDPDNLHDESLKIPQLHSKYYTLYNTITLLREEQESNIIKLDWKDIIIILEKQQRKYMQKNLFHIKFVKKMQFKDVLMQMIK